MVIMPWCLSSCHGDRKPRHNNQLPNYSHRFYNNYYLSLFNPCIHCYIVFVCVCVCTEPPAKKMLSQVMQGIFVCVCVCVKIGQA